MGRGANRFDQGKIADALADEDAAIALKADMAGAHAVWTLALAVRHNAGADAAADRALQIDPKQWIAWKAKSIAALTSGRYADADAAVTKEITLHDGDARAYVGRGTARIELGRAADGLTHLNRALALDPKLPVEGLRAAALLQLGRPDEALAAADRAVEADPKSTGNRMIRAGIRAATGHRAEAHADYDIIVAATPKPAYLVARASLWGVADRAPRDADIGAALKLDPHSPSALIMRWTRATLDALRPTSLRRRRPRLVRRRWPICASDCSPGTAKRRTRWRSSMRAWRRHR